MKLLRAFAVWFVVSVLAIVLAEDIGSARFERILDEHHDPKVNHVFAFEVWHDKVTGQEITCATSRDTNNTGGIDGKAYPTLLFSIRKELEMSNSCRGKKENNKKNWRSRVEFLKHQREGRPKQIWVKPTPDELLGHWEKV